MNEKFIRLLSPIRIAVVALLDIAVIAYAVFAIKKLIEFPSASVIFFAVCDFIALIVAVMVTKEIFSNGVKFYDDEMEFCGIDTDNIFAYDDIAGVETQKDTKASLVKNFVDRQSKVILTLKNSRVVTIDLGLTTKGGLEAVEKEINLRIK